MSEPEVYIKGYKVDRDKLKVMYGRDLEGR